MEVSNSKLPAGAGGSCTVQTGVLKLTVNVFEFGTERLISDFKFIVNQDAAENPFDPEQGNRRSTNGATVCCPVVATGDSNRNTVALPKGRYLVSVLAPGYKMGGNWINLNSDCTLAVKLLPYPLPLSMIRVRVFEDNHPVNGRDDFPFERGLPAFRIILRDAAGETATDFCGNPLGTVYQEDDNGNLILDQDGRPVPLPGTGGAIRTDENGDAVIENLLPGRYKVQALPPEGTDWIQSTTISGTNIIDICIEEGNDGYNPQEGFKRPLVRVGFVQLKDFAPGKGTGVITGRVRSTAGFGPPLGSPMPGQPVERPCIALNDLLRNDEQVYTGRGNPDGSFTIPGVPAGLYRIAVWDEPLEHIISFRTVRVDEEETVDLGEIGIPRRLELISDKVGRYAVANTCYDGIPVPGRVTGVLEDCTNLETDPSHPHYGEKRGIPYTPVGIRDHTGRLLTTVYTDASGLFEVLLPSGCITDGSTPSGVVPGMYQIIGNDPGDPDRPSANYNPHYQTLKQVVDVWPGRTTCIKVALYPLTTFVETPDSRFSQPPLCPAEGVPQLTSVSRVCITPGESRRVIIRGGNFGNARGTVTLNETPVPILVWNDRFILVRIPETFPPGPAQLTVTNQAGAAAACGITIHVLEPGTYYPPVIDVAPGKTIQEAVDSAPPGALIVVHPGIYYENPILYKNVKLQGMGPGATKLDGRFFRSYRKEWENKLISVAFEEHRQIPRGQVITVLSRKESPDDSLNMQIDGLLITGANSEEGGGVVVEAGCRRLEISNNVIRGNGGRIGGGIIIGRPFAGERKNELIRIHHNQIINNGGVFLAGGVGIFSGAHGYEFDHNEVCGNFSAGSGGGLAHYGLSHYGRIHHNRFLFNTSLGEGAGIFVGGEQPFRPEEVSYGSGAVEIYDNVVQFNIANDSGGGIRLLRTGWHRINLFNNVVTNNVSANLGGGLALGDASNVVVAGNIFAKNVTTATAEKSDGRPHAAGIVSQAHSVAYRAGLPNGAPDYSNPTLFENLFFDNQAGWFDWSMENRSVVIAGTGEGNDPARANIMDLEVFGTPAPRRLLARRNAFRKNGGLSPPGNSQSWRDYSDTQVTVLPCYSNPGVKDVKILVAAPETKAAPGKDPKITSPRIKDRTDEFSYAEKVIHHTVDSAPRSREGTGRDVLPLTLSARALYGNGIKLTWSGGSTGEEGYIIERSMMCENAFGEIDRVGAGTGEYIDACLFQRTRYFYRVKAYSAGGVIATSNIAVAVPSGPLAELPLAAAYYRTKT
ncbi:MAG: IPT/TIG domain-containing protein [Bacillota bacterium]